MILITTAGKVGLASADQLAGLGSRFGCWRATPRRRPISPNPESRSSGAIWTHPRASTRRCGAS